MEPIQIVNEKKFKIVLNRLAFQLIENHGNFENSVIIGLQPRGIFVANRLKLNLQEKISTEIQTGSLDITFYRDDFRRRERPLLPSVTNIDFSIENKHIILCDDVYYTGRTARAGMDALMAYGRPEQIELLTLVERRFSSHLPIKPDYIGVSVDSIEEEHVLVNWEETEGKDQVILDKKEIKNG